MLREKTSTIKILFVFFVIVSLLTVKVYAYDAAPDFTLTDIDGNEFSLSDFLGKVVILDFFGSKCFECLEEFPHLKNVSQEFGEALIIMSIACKYGDTVEVLEQIRIDYGIDWILALDTANVADKYNVVAVPVLVIIDPDGYIRYRHVGLTEASVLSEEVATIMPEPPPPPPPPPPEENPESPPPEENPESPPPEENPDPTSPPENPNPPPENPESPPPEENPEFSDPGRIVETPEFSAGHVVLLFTVFTLVALISGKVIWSRKHS